MKEREISLADLMVEILLHWRMIAVWMIVGGLLMGGFSYIRSARSVAAQNAVIAQQKEEQNTLAQLEQTLTPMQKNHVWAALNYEDFADQYKQSVLLQIDTTNVPKTEMTFYVQAGSLEQSCSIECWYEAVFLSGLIEWLTENNSTQADIDLSELITVISGTRNEMGSNSFTVQVIHLTEEECANLADQVEKYIEFLHTKFSANMEPHEIMLVKRSYALVKDRELLNQQRSLVGYITASDAEADRLINNFSDEESSYYDYMKNQMLEEDADEEVNGTAQYEEQPVSVSRPSISIKYILVGVILFVIIYVLYLFVKYILNNKLRVTDDIRDIYDISQLGIILQMKTRQRVLSCIDERILKLRNRNKRAFSAEEAIGLAATAVKMAVQKENVSEVFCVGCNVTEGTRKVAEQLQDILKRGNITLNILSNVLYDQEALAQLAAAKCVFLLETVGGTFYEEIAKELELLKRQEIKVLGGVIVG